MNSFIFLDMRFFSQINSLADFKKYDTLKHRQSSTCERSVYKGPLYMNSSPKGLPLICCWKEPRSSSFSPEITQYLNFQKEILFKIHNINNSVLPELSGLCPLSCQHCFHLKLCFCGEMPHYLANQHWFFCSLTKQELPILALFLNGKPALYLCKTQTSCDSQQHAVENMPIPYVGRRAHTKIQMCTKSVFILS